MSISLRYGVASALSLESDPARPVTLIDAPRGASLNDLRTAVPRSLERPLGFPPLAQALAPGDRVALALAAEFDRMEEVVAGVVEYLRQTGVEAENIEIVSTRRDSEIEPFDPRSGLPSEVREAVSWTLHDSLTRERLSLLAQTRADKPLYMNRRLCEADFVLPLGLSLAGRPAQGGDGSVFPTFADDPALRRFRRPGGDLAPEVADRHAREEIDEAIRLLGVQCELRVVAGSAGKPLRVVVGAPEAIRKECESLRHEAWRRDAPPRAPLVIAAVEGGPLVQSWENTVRAIKNASLVSEEGGMIAVCSDLAQPPGPGVQLLAGAEEPAAEIRRIRKLHPADAWCAADLAEVLSRARVFLLSRLDASLVEELGFAAVGEAVEIGRLARRASSALALANAPWIEWSETC